MNIKRQDVAEAPLRLIRLLSKQKIAASLDARKLLLSETKFHRDWRGLAENANFDSSSIQSSKISSTEHCLHLWSMKGGLIQDLWDALESMDRYDVIEDSLQFIYNDYDSASNKDGFSLRPIPPSLDEIISTVSDFDSNIITTDDQWNLNNGGSLQFYDALVLYADEDLQFVDEMVQKLEGEYNLKLCLRNRDLLGGLSFESGALIKLIEERCARVIVVLSLAFLKSNANKFLTQFAHALSIDQQRRIVIPCMVEPCQKPSEISYCHSLDFFRPKGYWDYWRKLADSINFKTCNGRASNGGAIIREIEYDSDLSTNNPLNSSILNSHPHSLGLDTNDTQSSQLHYSNVVLSRVKRKTDELEEKRCPKSTEVVVSPTIDVNQKNYSQIDKEDKLNTTMCCQPHRSSTNPANSSPSLIMSPSYNKRVRSLLRNVFKHKKQKEKIPC